jgi:hypothetical protein
MKHVQMIGLIACVGFFAGCESAGTASNTNARGTQESKRLAALQQQRRQAQPDEAEQNLWNAQQDLMNQDGNAARRY